MTEFNPIKQKKLKRSKRVKVLLGLSVIAFIGGLYLNYHYTKYLNDWEVQFRSPIQNWLVIEPRLGKAKAHVAYAETTAQRKELWELLGLTGVEKDICVAFGKDCQMALAISQAENGARQCDRIVIEPNNTVSIGLFMINSVHFKKFPVAQLVTCGGNIAAAKQIYTEQGNWNAWSVYKNQSYKKYLTN